MNPTMTEKHCTTCGRAQAELVDGLVYVEKDKPRKTKGFCAPCVARQKRMGLSLFTAIWNPSAMPDGKVESLIESDIKNAYSKRRK